MKKITKINSPKKGKSVANLYEQRRDNDSDDDSDEKPLLDQMQTDPATKKPKQIVLPSTLFSNEDTDSSVLSSSIDSSSQPSFGGGGIFSTDAGGFPSVDVVLPKTLTDNSQKHDPYFQFNGRSDNTDKGASAKERLSANLKGIELETLWESEGLDSDTEMSTPAPSFATSPSNTENGHKSPASIDSSPEYMGSLEVKGKIPGDISGDQVPISPLTINGKKTLFGSNNSAEGRLNNDDDSNNSTDSAIDLLNKVDEERKEDAEQQQECLFISPTVSRKSPSMPTSPTCFQGELLLEQYEINRNADALYLSKTEVVLAAYDRKANVPVTLKLMSDAANFTSELEGRHNLDPQFILPVLRALVDEDEMSGEVVVGGVEVESARGVKDELGKFVKDLVRNTSDAGVAKNKDEDNVGEHKTHHFSYVLCLEAYNVTLADTLARRSDVTCKLARKIVRDVVVALILLHTENKTHGNLSTHSIVRVGDRWKIKDLCMSRKVGEDIDMKQCKIAYSPPEVATRVLESKGCSSDLKCPTQTEYDLWSLGVVLYSLLLGSNLWNSDSHGYISSDDLSNLARWSPQSFLRMAYLYFPPDVRSDDERAAIDLISKLLMPTADDRKANFEFGIVSVHQHEFLEAHALEAESLVAFGERQAVMLRSETEQNRFVELTKSLSLEERWELNRSRDVILSGLFELTDVHTPTSFVVLTEKLKSSSSLDATESDDEAMQQQEDMYSRRLEEGLKWIELIDELGRSVRGSLDGDLSSVGHFWAKIKKTFPVQDYVFLYFIDDMTGEPVIPQELSEGGAKNNSNESSKRYPIEIKARSDLFPKLLPLMQVTMRSMALYHGVLGIARMFGCPRPKLTHTMRLAAQERINALKDEWSVSPFGSTFADDVAKLRTNKEQFIKGDSLRCKSMRALVRFLDKKIGCGGDFGGLKRLADKDGRAIWTTIDDVNGMKDAIQNRALERLCEERNLWDDCQDEQIRELECLLDSVTKRGELLSESLVEAKENSVQMKDAVERYRAQNLKLQNSLIEVKKNLEITEDSLEKEQSKLKLLWISKKNGSKKKKLSSVSKN